MLSIILFLLLCFLSLVSARDSLFCSRSEEVTVTFFGFPDNTPAGPDIRCDIEYKADCDACNNGNSSNILKATTCGPRNETAGGTGTFLDPLTMASSGKWFCHLEVVYLPYLQKYLRYEDYCQSCIDDANKGKPTHIDIWTGSIKKNGGKVQVGCENTLTPASMQTMIRNPLSDLPVDGEFIKIIFPSFFTDGIFPPVSELFTPNGSSTTCNGTIVGSAVTLAAGRISAFSLLLMLLQLIWSAI
jgi:hypothetical protein